MKKYTWKNGWNGKKINAEIAVEVFEKVEKKYGKLTPETLVEYSKNPKTALHSLFNWDNENAADQWRKQQARQIINNIEITVISDGKPVEIGAYEIVMGEDSQRSYKNVGVMTQNEVEYVRQATLESLTLLNKKLKIYRKFESAVFDIEKVIEKLSEIEITVN
jgi:hypothetical protein